MMENINEQQTSSFKRKLGNTSRTAKVHFNKDTDKTFKDSVQKLIIKIGFLSGNSVVVAKYYGIDKSRSGPMRQRELSC